VRNEKELLQLINAHFNPEAMEIQREQNLSVKLKKEELIQALSFLKSHSYRHLSTISCVDWLEEEEFELVYHLFSYDDLVNISLKTRIAREPGLFQTAKEIWPVAEFYERDIHEFFGVQFKGNDNLEEMILENWQYLPPMRKDFDTREFVNDQYEWRDYNGQKHTD
jgi:NADH-quinone oxidoreductase subunit C